MSGPWIDAHCHLADQRLERNLDEVIGRSRDANVTAWVQGGIGPQDWDGQRRLRASIGEGIRPTFGLHPWWVASHSGEEVDDAIAALPDALSEASGLGELGLDAHPKWGSNEETRDRQRRAFVAQLSIARDLDLPLVLHVVRAHAAALEILRRRGPMRGIVHSFSGSATEGRMYIRLGFHLSLSGGAVASSSRLKKLSTLPFERLLVETDAPDQRPKNVGARKGEHNEPSNLVQIAKALAPNWEKTGVELLDQTRDVVSAMFPPTRLAD